MNNNNINNTIKYYSDNAEEYINNTKDIDMTNLYHQFLKYIPNNGTILDVGFGSARDIINFKNLGYDVYGLDPVEEFCVNAVNLGIDKNKIYNYSILDFKSNIKYDGIWACASLLHLNKEELIKALLIIQELLNNNGYLYTSFKYGDYECYINNRYYINLTEDIIKNILSNTSLKIKDIWITEDKMSRDNKWLNVIIKK